MTGILIAPFRGPFLKSGFIRLRILIVFGIITAVFAPSSARAQVPFIGQVKLFAGNFAPRGWHDCDGALLPISQYTALFALIGTTYGGDGVTTFALPDLRGRAVLHTGQRPGGSNYVLGQTGGAESVTLTQNQMPSHSHTLRATTSPGSSEQPATLVPATAADGVGTYSSASNTTLKAGTMDNAGGGQPHPNVKPYLAVRYIIALEGLFPSRP